MRLQTRPPLLTYLLAPHNSMGCLQLSIFLSNLIHRSRSGLLFGFHLRLQCS